MSHLVCRRNVFDGEVGEVISVAPCGSSSLLHQVPERNSSEGERSVRLMLSEAQPWLLASSLWSLKIKRETVYLTVTRTGWGRWIDEGRKGGMGEEKKNKVCLSR